MRGFLLFFGVLVILWAGLPLLAGQPWLPAQLPLKGTGYHVVGIVFGLLMLVLGFRSKKKRKDVL